MAAGSGGAVETGVAAWLGVAATLGVATGLSVAILPGGAGGAGRRGVPASGPDLAERRS